MNKIQFCTFQIVFFSAGTVFFSHNKSAGTMFRLVFSAKRTEPKYAPDNDASQFGAVPLMPTLAPQSETLKASFGHPVPRY